MRKLYGVAFFLLCICLTGCKATGKNNMRNLEERDYATVLMIQKLGDEKYKMNLGVARVRLQGETAEGERFSSFECCSLEELREKYETLKGKYLSLAHLKVIIVTNVCPMENCRDYMEELRRDNEIAKTVPVLESDDVDALLKYAEDLKQPMGTYMSDLVRVKEREGRRIPWLMDYLKHMQEGREIFVYRIQIKKEGLKLTAYNNG